MLYSDMLQHPNWQRKRMDILQRDDFTCTLCGDKETQLHVHHKSYERDKKAWEYPISNLTTLCKHCHLLVTCYDSKDSKTIKICKSYSIDRKTIYLVTLLINQGWKHSIGLFRLHNERELEFKELIPHGEFDGIVKLIELSKTLRNGQ